MKNSKKIVIIGAGFGGLNAAKALGNSHHQVTLIDKTNHHLFQPLLYQVATAALSPADIAVPVRAMLKSYNNISVIMGNVIGINRSKKELKFQNWNMGKFLSHHRVDDNGTLSSKKDQL